jgi:serine protease Do
MAALALFGSALALAQSGAPETGIRRDATVAAIEKVMPSVVNIGTKTRRARPAFAFDWFRRNWIPYLEELPPQELAGSGVIIDEDGYVLTNEHVVDDATEIWVKVDGRVYQADRLVSARKTDVALLKIRAKEGEKFKAARFAADDDLMLGETVVALGNPYGLGGSVSKGILSAKNRREAFESPGQRLDVPDWLQTDASINPGNSGGPLINLNGEVIGINVAVLREGQGIGFAIPIKVVSEVLSDMYTPETLKQLWFGARVKAGQYPLVITGVEAGSPAAKAGLREGDLLLRVNNVQPRSFIEFSRQLLSAGEKEDVTVVIRRDRTEQVLKVRQVPENSVFNNELIRKKTGMELRELTPRMAADLGLNLDGGFVVSAVDRKSPAAQAGVQPGMVIAALDGRTPPPSVVWAARWFSEKQTGDKVALDLVAFIRQGNFTQRRTGKGTLTVL